MTLEEFDAFRNAVVEALPDDGPREWRGTAKEVGVVLLYQLRETLFGQELVERAERDLLKTLLAKYGEAK